MRLDFTNSLTRPTLERIKINEENMVKLPTTSRYTSVQDSTDYQSGECGPSSDRTHHLLNST